MANKFDETVNGLRSALDSAVGSSMSYVERAKVRSQLNDYYRRLGKAEYEAAMGGVSSMEEMNMLIGKITELRQTMYAMEQNASAKRGGTVTCPTCGKLNSAQDAYCPGCGAQLK